MDLITDIFVIMQFYYRPPHGTPFFWSSLSFVILTHICYVVLAVLTFCSSLTRMKQILWFLCLLPLSPLLPYIIYCASWPNSWITINIIDQYGLDYNGLDKINDHNNNMDKKNSSSIWKKFTSEKLITNAVFIIESLCESFFLSIIQIIAIVSFSEFRNTLILISISLSLLSIIWKSVLVSSGVSIASSIYKWLSFVTDFYGVLFVMISWAFLSISYLDINDNFDFFNLLNIDGISFLGYIYIYKIIFLVSPLVIFIVLFLIFELSIDSIHDFLCWQSRPFILLIVCYVPFVIIVVLLLIILALIVSIIIFEFAMFSWTAWFVEIFFNERYKWLDKPVFWDVIVNNFLLINTKNKKDLVLRLLIVNYILEQTTESEWVKRMFVDFKSFMSINEFRVFHDPKYTMTNKKLRDQFKNSNYQSSPTMFGSIIRSYTEHIRNLTCFNAQEFAVNITRFLILFIGIPFYILSRFITFIYPFFCIGYMLFYHAYNIKHIPLKSNFETIPIFCLITTLIYCILILILVLIGYKLYRVMNILWHIMPGRQKLVKSLIVDKPRMDYIVQLNAMYKFHINRPIIYGMLSKKFSQDVGKIILMHLPRTWEEQCRAEKTRRSSNRKRKRTLSRNNSVYSSVYEESTPSTSPHLAIDCVDPLPPMSRYCSMNDDNYNTFSTNNNNNNNINSSPLKNNISNSSDGNGGGDLSENDIFGINMTVPQLSIPMDCEDPLLLIKQHHRKSSLS